MTRVIKESKALAFSPNGLLLKNVAIFEAFWIDLSDLLKIYPRFLSFGKKKWSFLSKVNWQVQTTVNSHCLFIALSSQNSDGDLKYLSWTYLLLETFATDVNSKSISTIHTRLAYVKLNSWIGRSNSNWSMCFLTSSGSRLSAVS